MSTLKAPGKTPQEILQSFGNTIAELHERFKTSDKRKKLDWKAFDSYCRYEEKRTLRQLHALIRGEVIGEDVPVPEVYGDGMDESTDAYREGENYEKEQARIRNDRLNAEAKSLEENTPFQYISIYLFHYLNDRLAALQKKLRGEAS